jgi:hypothetical protein
MIERYRSYLLNEMDEDSINEKVNVEAVLQPER